MTSVHVPTSPCCPALPPRPLAEQSERKGVRFCRAFCTGGRTGSSMSLAEHVVHVCQSQVIPSKVTFKVNICVVLLVTSFP